MLDTTQLRTFAAVVREGSFEAAARSLHVTPSAVSQRIKALEQAVGQVLVRRTKPCGATDAGRPLLRLAGQVALLEREALDAARPAVGGPVPTRVTVVANGDSLGTWFVGALARLPTELALLFDVRRDDEHHTAELVRDGTAMAAVTAQREAVQGCRVERLGAMRYVALAEAGFAARHFPDGLTEAALASAPAMAFDRKDQLQQRFARTVTRRRLDPPIHYVPSFDGFNEAVRLGLGWGMVPERVARADIAAGRCVDLGAGRHLDRPLYWQHWRVASTTLEALTAAVRAVAAAELR
ncbi:LysR family transcriptional regulator ArgP [Micromonospora echinofusca]|uniref:LysR family transcriptional regulator ArgP n=1 Tax=Micromonospora echinofusca TaxID=47858 RepID=UPI000C713770|nr:LysR family transcriptional regulator ArgP [Micromonospora sp. MSM11]MCL7458897.1 LysR family transcriptional regulator ArgP [Micromonospora sp. MSM11]